MNDPLDFIRCNADLIKLIGSFVSGGVVVWLLRAFAGDFFVNLSVQLEPRRTPGVSPGTHDLVVLVKLKKGDRATLSLDEIVVWLFAGNKQLTRNSLLSEKPTCNLKSEVIKRSLNLTPREEIHFALHHTISDSCVCLVVARVRRSSIIGKRWRRAVWIAS